MHIRMQGYFAKGITQEVQGVQEESPELHEHGEVPASARVKVHNRVNKPQNRAKTGHHLECDPYEKKEADCSASYDSVVLGLISSIRSRTAFSRSVEEHRSFS